MKLKALLFSAILTTITYTAWSQQTIDPSAPGYQAMKEAGQIPYGAFIGTPGGANLLQKVSPPVQAPNTKAITACDPMPPLDGTWQLVPMGGLAAPYRNDDESSDQIALPFTFCLYGTNYNSLYINNNGNISFGSDYGTFTSNPFPDANFVMVAPFWGDVDTRNQSSGLVYYKLTSTSLQVRWDHVGYFNSMADKLNTFELIITDGNDPILPAGNNVAFLYGDMQWTTGGASGGTNGFGGTPATVGANKGDGVSFIQFGRFDHPGTDYDGPFNNADGVSWLDNQSFIFSVCTSNNGNNVAPIVSGIASCDTIEACAGTPVPIAFSFLSPEQGQVTTTVMDTTGIPGVTGTITNGNTSVVNVQYTGTNSQLGYHTITFTATDNGTPPTSTVVVVTIHVNAAPVPPTITGGAPFCPGQGSTTLVATPGYFSYSWSPGGGSNDSLVVTQGGTYTVTVDSGACPVASVPFTVNVFPLPQPQINGPATTCAAGNAVLSINSTGLTDILWTPGNSTNDTIIVGPGTYTVSVTDANGCDGSSTFTINSSDPQVTITGSLTTCFDAPIPITAHVEPVGNVYTYTWSPNVGSDSTVYVPSGQYIVTAADPSGNCFDSDTVNIVSYSPTVAIDGVIPYCSGDSILLNTNPASWADFDWYENGVLDPLGNNLNYADSGQFIVVVTDVHGCQATDTVNIDPVANPTANFTTTPDFGGVQYEPVQFVDQSAAGEGDSLVEWDWTFNNGVPSTSSDQNPTSTYSITGEVEVQLIVTTEIGCKDTITIPVEIVPDMAFNVITPNNDGLNDYFVFPVAMVKSNCQLLVYNRWGRKIYESENYQNDWNGDGHTDGVYYFVFLEPNGKEHKGALTILNAK